MPLETAILALSRRIGEENPATMRHAGKVPAGLSLALLVWSTLHAQDDYSDKINTNLGGGPGSRRCYGISTLIDPTLVRTTAVALC